MGFRKTIEHWQTWAQQLRFEECTNVSDYQYRTSAREQAPSFPMLLFGGCSEGEGGQCVRRA